MYMKTSLSLKFIPKSWMHQHFQFIFSHMESAKFNAWKLWVAWFHCGFEVKEFGNIYKIVIRILISFIVKFIINYMCFKIMCWTYLYLGLYEILLLLLVYQNKLYLSQTKEYVWHCCSFIGRYSRWTIIIGMMLLDSRIVSVMYLLIKKGKCCMW